MAARTFQDLLDCAVDFAPRLREAKLRLAGQCQWYPYETLSNLEHLRLLFAASATTLGEMAAGQPVLDIGAGDGDFAFLLEAAGFEVHALDTPRSSHNGMQAIRLMKAELGSRVEIIEADLDGHFSLGRYSLIFCLGVLYHLKNPLGVLERLAEASRYCVLSTRVMRQTADGARLEPHPLAYLLDDSELNRDNTNFWIFTPAGLRRLARRAGFATLHSCYFGDTRNSDPLSLREHDERVFTLLKNRGALETVELLSGWHAAEATGWRWTARQFSVRAQIPEGDGELQVLAALFISAESRLRLGPLTLHCRANGVPLSPQTYDSPGDVVYQAAIPRVALGESSVLLEFSLNKAMPAGEGDQRELGLIVASIDVSWR